MIYKPLHSVFTETVSQLSFRNAFIKCSLGRFNKKQKQKRTSVPYLTNLLT